MFNLNNSTKVVELIEIKLCYIHRNLINKITTFSNIIIKILLSS